MITGGYGFIGSAVVRKAIAHGYAVINVDALTYAACPDNLISVVDSSQYSFEHVDICDLDALHSIFVRHCPDAVIHLAAESHVDRSIDSPNQFIQTNVIGTFNLLEVSRSFWLEKGSPDFFRFHHVSTDEVFGSLSLDDYSKFTEDTPYDPRSPYSASKAASDHLVSAWHDTYGFPTLISNCSNNYGPYQFPEKLIPVVILNGLAGQPIPVYGDGRNVRDWLHVDDHADALIRILTNGDVARKYNIGGSAESSNIDLVRMICKIMDYKSPKDSGSYADQIVFVDDRPGHDLRYGIDSSRLKEELGWSATVSLEEGLSLTVEWYLNNEWWWKSLLQRNDVGHRLGKSSSQGA